MRAVLLTASLVISARAQEPPPKPTSPPKSAPQQPVSKAAAARAARLVRDLVKVTEQLDRVPHTYRGTLHFTGQGASGLAKLEYDFVGGYDDGLGWFALDDWRVVGRGERVAVSQAKAPWSKPQGNAPDVPISPRLLAEHLQHAELGQPQPAEFEDRPAVMVHAVWRGKAAKKVIWATAIPSTKHEALLDAIASLAARGHENIIVDAVVHYDPSNQQWLASTLRFALLDGRVFEADEEVPEPPKGLPAPTSQPIIQMTFAVQRCEPAAAPRPSLDTKAKAILGPPK